MTELATVDAGRAGCVQRTFFDVTDPTGSVIGVDAGYVSAPVLDPSGLPVHMLGNAFLQVTLHGVSADRYTGPTDLLGFNIGGVAEMRQTQNFEATVTWVIGLDRVRPFRVFQLSASSVTVETG